MSDQIKIPCLFMRGGSSRGPYFLKSKYNVCEPAIYHKNGNKRICPPQPFN